MALASLPLLRGRLAAAIPPERPASAMAGGPVLFDCFASPSPQDGGRADILARHWRGDMGDFWVFGYGSLMWRPGFAHVETRRARLHGFRRALCVRSWVHRGTQDRPGLVLGLDRGGSCIGLAFRVPGELSGEVLDYLRARELVTNVYLERRLPLSLDDGRRVEAVSYVVDRSHRQYAGALHAAEAAETVRGAAGQSGPNEEYVVNTVAHLEALGIRDHWLEEVAARLAAG